MFFNSIPYRSREHKLRFGIKNLFGISGSFCANPENSLILKTTSGISDVNMVFYPPTNLNNF